MVDLSASSAFGIVLAFVLGKGPVIYYALQTPTSTPREVAAYVLVAAVGVVYLLVQNINVFDPTGVGVIAYLGESQARILGVDATDKIRALLPHKPANSPTLRTS